MLLSQKQIRDRSKQTVAPSRRYHNNNHSNQSLYRCIHLPLVSFPVLGNFLVFWLCSETRAGIVAKCPIASCVQSPRACPVNTRLYNLHSVIICDYFYHTLQNLWVLLVIHPGNYKHAGISGTTLSSRHMSKDKVSAICVRLAQMIITRHLLYPLNIPWVPKLKECIYHMSTDHVDVGQAYSLSRIRLGTLFVTQWSSAVTLTWSQSASAFCFIMLVSQPHLL